MAKILLVDDDLNVTVILSVTFKNSGHDVFTASDGNIAIEKVIEVHPDLVITDVEMPNKNGYELVKTLRASNLTKNIPIIMLSSLSEDRERIAGLELGADDYIPKPFNAKEVAMKAELLIKRHAALRGAQGAEVMTQAGKSILFFGVKGGVGTTTLAVNTALAMKAAGANVCAWDMNMDFEVLPFLLNIHSSRNISHLFKESLLDLNSEVFESYLTLHHESGLKILAAPEEVEVPAPELLDPRKVNTFIKFFKSFYSFILADAGSRINSFSMPAIESADMLLVCVTLDVLSMYNLKTLYAFLQKIQFNFDKVHIIVNNVHKHGDIRIEEMKKETHFSVLETIENDGPNFLKAVNAGKTYLHMFPKSKPAVQIRSLAEKILQLK